MTSSTQATSLLWWVTVSFAFFALGMAFNWHGMHAGFVSDDFGLVDLVRQGGPFADWTHPPALFLRPLITLSLWLNYKTSGINPFAYHLTNVTVHVLNSVLVTAVSLQLLQTLQWNGSQRRAALVAGVLFLVQPIHAEAVTWVVGRTDVIATFFYLASFSAYLTYRGKTAHSTSWLGLSLLLFCFSLLSKELAVTLPLLILLTEVFLWKGREQKVNPSVIAFFAVVVVYVVLRRVMIGKWVGGYAPMELNSSKILSSIFFLTAAFLPPVVPMKFTPVLLASILGVCLLYRRKGYALQPVMGFCVLALLLTFLPVLPLMQDRPLNGLNGRLIYVGTSFSCLLMALVGDILLPSAGAFLTATALLTALNGAFLIQANRHWWDLGTLCRSLLSDAAPVLPAKRLYILNIPDNLNGLYVFRNGISGGLDMKYNEPVSAVHVISYLSLTSSRDSTTLTRLGSNSYILQTRPGSHSPIYFLGSSFDANNMNQGDGFYAFRSKEGDSVQVHLTGLGPSDRMLYYSAGHFIPVPISATSTALLQP